MVALKYTLSPLRVYEILQFLFSYCCSSAVISISPSPFLLPQPSPPSTLNTTLLWLCPWVLHACSLTTLPSQYFFVSSFLSNPSTRGHKILVFITQRYFFSANMLLFERGEVQAYRKIWLNSWRTNFLIFKRKNSHDSRRGKRSDTYRFRFLQRRKWVFNEIYFITVP